MVDVPVRRIYTFCNHGASSLSLTGPDEVVPADSLFTWLGDQPVKLRMGESGYSAEKPISVPTMFKNVCAKVPTGIALCKYCQIRTNSAQRILFILLNFYTDWRKKTHYKQVDCLKKYTL